MSRRLSRWIFVGIAMFVLGWALVLVSGYGGGSSGNFGGFSELVWRIGGVMLYVSVPVMLTVPLVNPFGQLRSAARRLGQRA
jgi:uncharacterized membrane protein